MTTRITKPDNAPANLPITWNTSGDLAYAILFENIDFDIVASAKLGVKKFAGSDELVFFADTANGDIVLVKSPEDFLIVLVKNSATLPQTVGTYTLVLTLIDGFEWAIAQAIATGTKGTL